MKGSTTQLKQVWPQTLTTYLGNKGYTLLKKELSAEQQLLLKEMLMAKPFVPGAPVTAGKNTFPVYRESANKLYIPRYFGENLFGPAKTIHIGSGDPIHIPFAGVLRDYQEPVVQKFIDYVNSEESLGGLLELPCAWGKTSAALNIASQIGEKTIVIVHKEFLMNQWIERIAQFLPSAKIGKIQGKIIDIEGKDIVLCMLQSLVMKEYPPSLFTCFGLTIIDEVHHISSESFSNALFKLVTKYTLGLSATMDRKDGTSKVFKMFLGKVVHKAERKTDQGCQVQVRAITFKSKDPEFNETTLDWKGNPQISTMISKLCSFSQRTEFIVQVITDFLEVDTVDKRVIQEHKRLMNAQNPCCRRCSQNHNYLVKNTCCQIVQYCLPCIREIEAVGNKCPDCFKRLKYEQHYIHNPYVKPLEQQHTLILSHNLNVLHYIYNKIVCKNIASVGYYVGGMKEHELKQSEKKQLVLASFSMASEALDIPSLNAEFLITPKTDIVQSVGRILRAKHAFSDPIIYDIKDTHDVFRRQWLKRKNYYKQQNYHITECDSLHYDKSLFTNKTGVEEEEEGDDLEEKDDLDKNTGVCLLLPINKKKQKIT
jgi:superfamily II DNA or RNA helicase